MPSVVLLLLPRFQYEMSTPSTRCATACALPMLSEPKLTATTAENRNQLGVASAPVFLISLLRKRVIECAEPSLSYHGFQMIERSASSAPIHRPDRYYGYHDKKA